jgi:hypothetical protein
MILYLYQNYSYKYNSSYRNKSNTELSNFQQIKRMAKKINTLNLYHCLRKHRGSIARLAGLTGFKPLYVRLVLQEKRNSLSVVEKGITLLKTLEAEELQRNKEVDTLQQKINQATHA